MIDRVTVSKSKSGGLEACSIGPAYDSDTQVEVRLTDITNICEYSNERSYMRVGKQLRRYKMGTPMGEQSSCAKANGVCLDDELTTDATWQQQHGDSCRNLSLAFVDDKHIQVAWDDTPGALW